MVIQGTGDDERAAPEVAPEELGELIEGTGEETVEETGEETGGAEIVPVESAAAPSPDDAKLDLIEKLFEIDAEAAQAALDKLAGTPAEAEKPAEEEAAPSPDADALDDDQMDAAEYVRHQSLHVTQERQAVDACNQLTSEFSEAKATLKAVQDDLGTDHPAYKAALRNVTSTETALRNAYQAYQVQKRAVDTLEYADKMTSAIPQLKGLKMRYAMAIDRGQVDPQAAVPVQIAQLRAAGYMKAPAKPAPPVPGKEKIAALRAKWQAGKQAGRGSATAPAARTQQTQTPARTYDARTLAIFKDKGWDINAIGKKVKS